MQVLNPCLNERLVGDPIDVFTGSNLDRIDDFRIAGPPHFEWIRRYDSRATSRNRGLGPGFIHALDHVLLFDLDGIQYQSGDGSIVTLPFLEKDGSCAASAGCVLTRRSAHEYVLLTPKKDVLGFWISHEKAVAPVAWIRARQFGGDFYYDKSGQLREFRRSDGLCLALEYDVGRLVSVCLPSTLQGKPRILVRYGYDGRGRLQSVEDGDGARQGYEYDVHDRVVLKVDRRGYKFFYEHDNEGRCVRARGQDGVQDVRLEYSPAERFTRVTLADGGVWQYFADEQLNLKLIVDPRGGARKFEYDSEGRLIRRIDALGNKEEVHYDANGSRVEPKVRSFKAQGGDTPLEWEFGCLCARPDPKLAGLAPAWLSPLAYDALRMSERPRATRRVERNAQGFALREVNWDGHERSWTRDGEGNILAYTDLDGHRNIASYSSWNHFVREINPCGGIVTRDYDANERVRSVRDPGGTETRYVYDLSGNLVEVHRHGRLRERYVYDLAGNLIEKRDTHGKTLIRLEIEPGNRKCSRILASGDRQVFEYDKSGKFSKISGLAGTLSLEHDSEGRRLCDERDGLGVRHEFSGGVLIRTTILGRFTVTYEHSRDRVAVTDPTGRRHEVQMDRAVGVIERRFGNGITEYLRYGIRGECLARFGILGGGRQQLWSRSYFYTPEGDLRLSERDCEERYVYRYDANHRLVESEFEDGSVRQYGYDVAGNLLSAPGLKATIGPGNRIAATDTDEFEFDDRDFVCARTTFHGTTRYTYDSRGLLSRVEGPGVSYQGRHDPLGRRTEKCLNGAAWKFYWDRDRLAAEVFPDSRVRVYVYVDDKALVPMLFVDYDSLVPGEGACYYPVMDHLGCITGVVNDSGSFVWRTEMTPFGEVSVEDLSAFHQPLRWPGHYHDKELGLHDNRFRTYVPALGRYLQCDPMGLAGGMNLYAYAENNPLRLVDHNGLAANPCPLKPKDDDEKPEDGPDKELSDEKHLKDVQEHDSEMKLTKEEAEAIARQKLNEHLDKIAKGEIEISNKDIGPVIAVTVDRRTGYVSDVKHNHPDKKDPEKVPECMKEDLAKMKKVKGHPSPAGSHAEVHSTAQAMSKREADTGQPVTKGEVGEFTQVSIVPKNVTIGGEKINKGDDAARCGNCQVITDGVHCPSGNAKPIPTDANGNPWPPDA